MDQNNQAPSPQQSTPPETTANSIPPTWPKSGLGKSLLFTLGGAVLLIVGIVGGFLYANMNRPPIIQNIANTQQDIQPSPTQSVQVPSSLVTNTGNTYTNTKYKYSLKYQDTLTVSSGVGMGTGDEANIETVSLVRVESKTPSPEITIWIMATKTDYKSLDEFEKDLGTQKPNAEVVTVLTKEKTMLSNTAALQYVIPQPGAGNTTRVTTIKNGYLYTITLDFTTPEKMDEFAQIVSSFMITN